MDGEPLAPLYRSQQQTLAVTASDQRLFDCDQVHPELGGSLRKRTLSWAPPLRPADIYSRVVGSAQHVAFTHMAREPTPRAIAWPPSTCVAWKTSTLRQCPSHISMGVQSRAL